MAGYYAEARERTGFRDFYAFLEQQGGRAIAHLLRPFATGSLRHLLSDEGDDLLTHEALVTVFDLHLLEPELRPAAAMVAIVSSACWCVMPFGTTASALNGDFSSTARFGESGEPSIHAVPVQVSSRPRW